MSDKDKISFIVFLAAFNVISFSVGLSMIVKGS